MTDCSRKIAKSGYSEAYREVVVKSGVAGFERQVEASRKGETSTDPGFGRDRRGGGRRWSRRLPGRDLLPVRGSSLLPQGVSWPRNLRKY